MNSDKWLRFKKTVRFGDCDTANVIHFHNLFRWSHEFWEESLEIYGINFHEIFPCAVSNNQVLYPIINSEAKFFRPINLGDILIIRIVPLKINNHLFKVNTFFFKDSLKVAESIIIHCSISADKRIKVSLPEHLEKWIEASAINNNVEEC